MSFIEEKKRNKNPLVPIGEFVKPIPFLSFARILCLLVSVVVVWYRLLYVDCEAWFLLDWGYYNNR